MTILGINCEGRRPRLSDLFYVDIKFEFLVK